MRKVWKPTSKEFTEIGYSWKPTRRIFIIAGNRCPLTRIIATKEVPLKETTITLVITQSPALKVYNRKPKASRSIRSSSKAKIVEFKTSNTKEPKQSWGSTVYDILSSTIIDFKLFWNDHIAKIMGYGDYQMGNITISQVYYVEGLEDVDLLKGSRGSNLYTLSLENLMLSSPICLLSKASKTNKKHSHKPKAEDSIQEKLYLLHMDLCGPMRIQSITGRKYILVIVDDYSRTDDGTEFVNQTLRAYYEEVGISLTKISSTMKVSLLTVALGFLLRVLAALIYLRAGMITSKGGGDIKGGLSFEIDYDRKTTYSPHVNKAVDMLNTSGSINDQPKYLSTASKAAYNLRSGAINVDGRVLDVNGKPMKVRRKVVIASNLDEEMAAAYTAKPAGNEDVSQATSGHGINDARNKEADPKPMSFASVVNSKQVYENSLVGFFVGKILAFLIVQNYVNNTKFGLEKVTRNDDRVFLFKFASKGSLDQVLKRGPWMIRKSPLILSKWTPNVPLTRNEVTKVPVWIKLRNIPLVAYSEDGLSLIATQIGKPIMLDAFTSLMCSDSWGRISYARALVEISADTNLKKEVSIWPILLRHFLDTCPKTISEPAATMDNHGDGFTKVKSRKTNEKMADQKAKMSHISGIRLNKPKPNFYRPKPAKENDHGKGCFIDDTRALRQCSNNIKSRVNSFEALNSLDEDGNADHIAKEVNEGLCCKHGSSRGISGESNSIDGVDSFISSYGGDQHLKEDEVYDYDGYETQFGDQFDIRLKGCNRKVTPFTKKNHIVYDTEVQQNQGQDMGDTDDQPNVEATPKHDWFKKPERPQTPNSDWIIGKLVDFRPPQTWISKITQAEKPPLSFDKLTSRQVVPVDYFINNDLEYLRGGSSSKKYTTYTTKTKAAKYDIQGIEDMVPSLLIPTEAQQAAGGPTSLGATNEKGAHPQLSSGHDAHFPVNVFGFRDGFLRFLVLLVMIGFQCDAFSNHEARVCSESGFKSFLLSLGLMVMDGAANHSNMVVYKNGANLLLLSSLLLVWEQRDQGNHRVSNRSETAKSVTNSVGFSDNFLTEKALLIGLDVNTASVTQLILLGLMVYAASIVRYRTRDAFGSRIELFLTTVYYN
ncbi:integrase, catalytic region, zinc finger, CCHC-type containing protein [Tanacetum coccineum]